MSIRPTEFYKDGVWKWDIYLSNSADSLIDADSNPTVTVFNGDTATGEAVTITKVSGETGHYRCSFNPAGESEGDVYGFSEVVVIAGQTRRPFHWKATVKSLAPTTVQIRQEIDSNSTKLDATVSSRLAAASYTAPPTTAQIEAALLNDGDGQALLAAISAQVQALFDAGIDVPVATLVSLVASQVASTLATAHGSGSWEGSPDLATTAQVEALIASVLAKLPAALVNGRMDVHVGAMATNVITVAATTDALVDRIQDAAATPDQVNAAAQSVITHGDGVGDWGGGGSVQVVGQILVDGFTVDGQAQLMSSLQLARDDGDLAQASCRNLVEGDDWRLDFADLGDLSGRANLVFVMKTNVRDTDSAALIHIDNDGLKRVRGQAAQSAADGSIVVTDDVLGTGYVLVKAVATAGIDDGPKSSALKVIRSSGVVRVATLWRPCFSISGGAVDQFA